MTENRKNILWIIIIGLVSMIIAMIMALVFNIRDGRLPAVQLGSYIVFLFIYGWVKNGSLIKWLKEFV
jgi:drug/metabolite transporter superfamily protein YnfA